MSLVIVGCSTILSEPQMFHSVDEKIKDGIVVIFRKVVKIKDGIVDIFRKVAKRSSHCIFVITNSEAS
jgi:hypothetical protein